MLKPEYLETDGRSDRWLISYADVITILLILFTAIAAQAVQRKTTPAEAAPPPAPLQRTAPVLDHVRRMLAERGLEPRMEPKGLVVSIPQAVLYAPGHDEISPAADTVVASIAEVLREIPNKVMLIGHADARPIRTGRFRNNWELSAARGVRLLELLTERYGIAEERLSTAGQGAFKPRDSNDTEDGRAANRRVEIVILDETPPRPPEAKPSPLGHG
jgi:chemotaxis protein MotB